MKKRLLSAALALAMVLTLLPVSAFAAAPDYVGKSVTYYADTLAASSTTNGRASAGWYGSETVNNFTTYTEITSGVVSASSSTAESGTLYSDIGAAITANANYIKLVGAVSDASLYITRTVDIDMHGKSMTSAIALGAACTLTLRDTQVAPGESTDTNLKQAAGAITGNKGTAYTVNLHDVKVTSIALDGIGAPGTNINTGETVNMYGALVTSTVDLDGNNSTLNMSGSSITRLGSKVTSDVTLDGDSGLKLDMKGGSTVGGNATLTGAVSGGTVNLGDGALSPSATITGQLTIASPYGGTLTAKSGVLSVGVILTGYQTTIDATSSSLKAVKVFGTTDTNKKTSDAPKIIMKGGSTADSIEKQGSDAEVLGNYQISIGDGTTASCTVSTITLDKADITVTGSTVSGKTSLGSGTLKLMGNKTTTGQIELGSKTETSDAVLEVADSATNVTTSSINRLATSTNTVKVKIPAVSSNNFGGVNLTSNYQGTNIKGGNFFAPVNNDYLDSTVEYQVNMGSGTFKYSYYTGSVDKVNELVTVWQNHHDEANFEITTSPMGTTGTDGIYSLWDNGVQILAVKFNGPAGFTLPNKVNGDTIVNWTNMVNQTTQAAGGTSVAFNDGAVPPTVTKPDGTTETLTYNPTFAYEAHSSNFTVSKVLNVAVMSTNEATKYVQAELNGNVITLTGSVNGKGSVIIPLRLTTDVEQGKPEHFVNVDVVYNVSGKTATFTANSVTPQVLSVVNNALLVNNGTKYTLSASLSERPAELQIGAPEIVTTWNSNLGTAAYVKSQGEAMTTSASGCFDFTKSPAMNQAVGAAIARVNTSSFAGWLTAARTDAWKKLPGNANKTPTADEQKATGYDTIYLVPYLDVKVSKYVTTGCMTATLTPMYRIEVRSNNATYSSIGPMVVQQGQTLSLTKDLIVVPTDEEVKVQLPMPSDFAAKWSGYAHQNALYVTQASKTGATLDFNISHIASDFGTFVFNTDEPTVRIPTYTAGNPPVEHYGMGYNALQNAVDDVRNNERIVVTSKYTGSKTINVTGEARTFYIEGFGNNDLTVSNTNGVIKQWQAAGKFYTIQLTKDNIVVKPTEKPIPITVASVTGGSASLSVSRADEGETITVTLTPAANYRVGGVTVTAAVKNSTTGVTTNTTVSTTAASANSWRFVVPTGATSVTVTPSFVKVNTNATVTVSNPAVGGTAVTSAGNSQVAPGTPVSVTVSPATGYRTMGIYVTNATATRTGANTFSFIVPSGVTNVVVTPRFDRNNGTLFEDVWSTDYFSNAVGWAVGRGITNGDGSVYRFGTGKSCTREDMVTFLWRNAGSPIVTGVSNPFWDVQVGSYYYNAVMWAVKNGITKGVSANQFGVGRAVTRGEAVTFLYRAAGEPAASTNSGFYDVPSGEYYAKAVSWAVGKGITNGDGSTVKFSPNGYCLREQIVTFMYRNATGTRA